MNDILKRFNMDECRAVASPMDMSCSRLVLSDSATKVNNPFREAVGTLMHLTTATRPDIAYAISYVWRFMDNPHEDHWIILKRIFCYLQDTKTHGICYKPVKARLTSVDTRTWTGPVTSLIASQLQDTRLCC